jgi:glycosyltransferase involved in cell wall biosynthesis
VTVLQLLKGLEVGGLETYVIKLARALSSAGHRVIVASSGGALLPQLDRAGVPHFHLSFSSPAAAGAILKLRQLIRREKVELLNAHNWTAGAIGYLASYLAGIPYVFTVHGVRKDIQRFMVFYWGRKVIALSPESRERLVRRWGLEEDRVVESIIGVDTEIFSPRPADQRLAESLGLDPQAPKIAHICRFRRTKAAVALALIEAAPTLEKLCPGVQALLVGGGVLEDKVRHFARQMNKAVGRTMYVCTGSRDDVADLLNLGGVVVGTASVALEAMSCGKPLVAAGKAGFFGLVTPENFEQAYSSCFGDHGHAGYLPSTTAEALAEASCSVLRPDMPGLASRLSSFGRSMAVERFSLESMARSVEAIYLEAMGARPAYM